MLTIEKAIDRACENGLIEFIALDYAEPGYSNPTGLPILFANWNARTTWDREKNESVETDATPRRLGDLAEKAGYELEWSDEWCTCDACSKAVRTSPNSYGWTRSYFEDDNTSTITCHECVKEDPAEYLAWLEGHPRRAMTIEIDLTAHGYVKVNQDSYEHGMHPGQNDDPTVVAKSLRAKGISRFLFVLDDVGQFDARFSVWVHEDERELLQGEQPKSDLPYDPAEEMAKALRGEHSDHYTLETRMISKEEFVTGSWAKERK